MQTEKKMSEFGRTMLEVLMALLILGMISAGGYAGVRYALGLSQAWRAQAQVNQLAKDVTSLYAWQDSYATLSMRGSRGICNTIVSPGNQDCTILSPWNEEVSVQKGKSNASFKIVLKKTPKSICEHLMGMRFETVFMVQKDCTSGLQDVEFLMNKDDRSCPEGCPAGYDCINGACYAQDREDACENVNCAGECLTGVCRGGTCLRKMNGSSCSFGVCQDGACVEETTTTTMETTTPDETTTTEEITTPPLCGLNEIYVGGTCYSCNQYEPIYAWDMAELQGCSNRTIACGIVGTMDCKSFLKQCPEGYIETGSTSCQTGEIPINDGSVTYDYVNTGCCKIEPQYEICPDDQPLMDKNGKCYPCNTPTNVVLDSYTKGNCAVCPQRVYVNSGYTCRLNTCTTGQIMDSSGTCRPCDYASGISVPGIEDTCTLRCPERQLKGSTCYKKCTSSSAPLFSTSGSCSSCTTDYYTFLLSDNPDCTTDCPNRIAEGDYCIINNKCGVAGTTNASKPLMDYRGKCYACDTTSSVYMGDLPESACSGVCSNRTLGGADGKYCAPKTCPSDKPLKDRYGNCYSCTDSKTVYVYDVKTNCNVCPNRELVSDYCVLPCGTGVNASKPLQDRNSGTCYECSYSYSVSTQNKENCTKACPKRVFSNTSCILNTCSSATPLRDTSGACHACNTTAAVSVGTNGTCTETCSNRVLAGTYCRLNICSGSTPLLGEDGVCYSCDTSSNVRTSREACAVCPERMHASSDNSCRKCGANQMLEGTTCRSCSYSSDIDTWNREEDCEKYCGAYRSLNGRYCYRDCSKASSVNVLSYYGSCYNCNTTLSIPIDTNPKCETLCSNRINTGLYCMLDKKCGTGDNAGKPLTDYLGVCYACDTTSNVYMPGRESECKAKCPGRTLSGSYCVNTCAGKPLLNKTNLCYACDEPVALSNIINCSVCSNRHMTSSYCLPNCPSGTPLQYVYDGKCYSCDHDTGINTGTKEACESACPNRVYINGSCYKTCPSGQFPTTRGCVDCHDPGKIDAMYFTKECSASCPNRALTEGRYCVLK